MSSSPETAAREKSWLHVMDALRDVVRDEYDVLALLGFGGFAGVFLAQEHRLRRRVALKVMSPEMMLTHNMIERFHQEAVTQANLNHPNIASVYMVREQGGLHFFAMQYIPGRTLQGALRAELDAGRPLDISVVRTLLHQIGSALEYAHGEGVIHRDVKPGNVILSGDGRAVVTDFGIAKVAEGPALTMASMVQGTAAYMSPEQCYATELKGASDQYSLGIMAFELVTGHVPFVGDAFSVMQAHVGSAPPPLRSERADSPLELEAAVGRMLSKAPGDRFPSIAAALDAMHAQALSPRKDDPIRRELIRLADCEGVLARMGDDVRRAMLTPRSSEIAAIGEPRRTTPPSGATAPPPTRARGYTPSVPTAAIGSATAATRSIRIAPHPTVIALGEQLTLTAHDDRGAPVAGPIAWTVEPADIGQITANGEVMGQRWGRARIRAQASGGLVAESDLIVGIVPLQRLELTDMPTQMPSGSTATIAVRLFDMAGRERAIPVQLSSSNELVLVAEGPDRVRAMAPGRAELVASCGSVGHRVSIDVRP